MKLHEILPTLGKFRRIKRNSKYFYLVRSEFNHCPLVELDLCSLQMGYYSLTYDDLVADDWEIVEE